MDAEKYFNEASRKLSDKRSNNLLQVSWLMTQSTSLTKKTYSLKKWLTDCLSFQKLQSFTFHPKYKRKISQEDP